MLPRKDGIDAMARANAARDILAASSRTQAGRLPRGSLGESFPISEREILSLLQPPSRTRMTVQLSLVPGGRRRSRRRYFSFFHAAWVLAENVARVTDMVVPSGPAKVSTWAPSWCASALTILVPSRFLTGTKMPSGLPIPLSATESFQFVPAASYPTVIQPSVLSPGNPCLRAFITSSVTIKPRHSASRDVVLPPSPQTFREIGRVSPIIELARASHSFAR